MHNFLWALALFFLVIGVAVVCAGAFISGTAIVGAGLAILLTGDKLAHDHGI